MLFRSGLRQTTTDCAVDSEIHRAGHRNVAQAARTTNMRIVIAPDSFKESLSATEVASAMAQGALAGCGEASIDLCPMAGL